MWYLGRLILALLVLSALLPDSGKAVVTFQQASEGESGTDLQPSWVYNVTVGNGNNRALFVGLCTANGASMEVTAATYNGDPLTQIAHLVSTVGDIVHVYFFYLLQPDVGTFPVSFTVSTGRRQASGAIVLTEVDQTTPQEGNQTAANADNSTSISVTATTTTGEMLVDIGCKRLAPNPLVMTALANRTERYNIVTISTTNSNNVWAGGSTRTGSGALAMSWSGTDTAGYAVSASNVNAAVVVPPAGTISLGIRMLQ